MEKVSVLNRCGNKATAGTRRLRHGTKAFFVRVTIGKGTKVALRSEARSIVGSVSTNTVLSRHSGTFEGESPAPNEAMESIMNAVLG